MRKFRFRFQTVLHYREGVEQQALEEYRAAQLQHVQCLNLISEVASRRTNILKAHTRSIAEHLAQEAYLQRLDGEEADLNVVLGVLVQEEQKARERWLIAKQELEILNKLQEKEYEEWRLESDRREQAELDEWAITRR